MRPEGSASEEALLGEEDVLEPEGGPKSPGLVSAPPPPPPRTGRLPSSPPPAVKPSVRPPQAPPRSKAPEPLSKPPLPPISARGAPTPPPPPLRAALSPTPPSALSNAPRGAPSKAPVRPASLPPPVAVAPGAGVPPLPTPLGVTELATVEITEIPAKFLGLSPIPPARLTLTELEPAPRAEAPSLLPVGALPTELYAGQLPSVPVAAAADPDPIEAARELIVMLEAQVKVERSSARLGRLHFEWGRLAEAPLFDLVEAKAHYQKAHELIPNHDGTLSGLVRTNLALGEYAVALRFLDSRIRLTRAPAARAQLLLFKGYLLEDHLGRSAEARRAFEQAQELAPQDPSILRALSRRLRADKAWAELDLVLAAQVEVAEEGSLRAGRLARRARLAEARRKRPDLAAELFEGAFRASAEGSAAVVHLERLHGSLGHNEELGRVLTARAELLKDREVRASSLERRGQIELDRLKQFEAGLASYEAAHEALPQNVDLLRRLTEQYERLGWGERAVLALTRLDQAVSSDSERASIRARAARICEQELQDPVRARAFYELAREADPRSAVILLPLKRLYRQTGAYRELVRALLMEEEMTRDGERRAMILFEVAELCERELDSPADARTFHGRALAVKPGFGPSERALARLYGDAKMIPQLIELFERAAEASKNEAVRLRYLFKIAALFEQELGEHDKALEVYKRILEQDASNREALFAGALAAERSADWATLVGLLEREAELSTDPGEKVALLLRAAKAAREPAASEALYQRVLGVAPDNLAALRGLAVLHESQGRADDMLEVRRREAELSSDPGDKAQIYFAMAEVLERQLNNIEQAILHLKRAVVADKNHRAAKERLLELLERAGHFAELERLLAEERTRVEDKETKVAFVLRQARLLENVLDRPGDALATYVQGLDLEPSDRLLVEGRLRLLARLSRPSEYVEALEGDAAGAREPRLALWERLVAAEVAEDELEKPALARGFLEAVLKEHPRHPLALLLLEEIGVELGERDLLREALLEQVEHFGVGEQIAALRELLRGATGEERLDLAGALLERSPYDILALYERERAALEQKDPTVLALADAALLTVDAQPESAAVHQVRTAEHLETRDPRAALLGFRRALELDSESVAAARGLSRLARRLNEPTLLAEAAELEASVTGDKLEAARLLTAAAHLTRDFDGERAIAFLERALVLDPNSQRAASLLVSILSTLEVAQRLSTILSTAAQAATDPASIAAHWTAVASVYADRVGDVGAAIAALARVEKRLPNERPAIRALGELYLRDRQYAPAAEKFERAKQGETDPEILTLLELKLAELYMEQLDRRAEAQKTLDAVLARSPQNRVALRRLLTLQMDAKEARAPETARLWADAADGAERARALSTLGRLLRERGSREAAVEAFLPALPLVGASEGGPLVDLLDLVSDKEPEELERLAQGLELHARAEVGTPAERAESAFQAAKVLFERRGDVPRAAALAMRALELWPNHVPARSLLVSVWVRAGDKERAIREAQELIAVDGARKDSWAQLRTLLESVGRLAEAELATGPLTILGAATELERSSWLSRSPRAAQVVPGTAREAMGPLLARAAEGNGATIHLLNQLSELGPKMFATGLDAYGLSTRDRIGPRMNHPLRVVLDRVLRAFSVSDVDLYPTAQSGNALRLVFTDPLGIVVPVGVASLSEAEQVFLFSELVCGVALHLPILFALEEPDVRATLLAALRLQDGRAEVRGAPEGPALEDLSRRIARAPSWLAKGRFEEAVRRYLAEPSPDFDDFVAQIRRGARALALVLSDDLAPVGLLRRTEGAALHLRSDQAELVERELLADWLGKRAVEARKIMGLLS